MEELGVSPLEDDWSKISSAIRVTAMKELRVKDLIFRNDWYKIRAFAEDLGDAMRENKAKYRLARNDIITVLIQRKRQHKDPNHDELEKLFRAIDTQKSYKKVNYVPQVDIIPGCRRGPDHE